MSAEVACIEVDPVREAFADLVRAHKALNSRRGPIYRQLERDIETRAATILKTDALIHDLGDGYFVMGPPDEVVSLLRRARALGLI